MKHRARHNLSVILGGRIAGIYLDWDNLRIAGKYTNRISDPTRQYDIRNHLMKFCYEIETEHEVSNAGVLAVSAQISQAFGNIVDAEIDMSIAHGLDPSNVEFADMSKAYRVQRDLLLSRQEFRRDARRLQIIQKQNKD